MADNINTRAIVYDMLMSVEKENTPSHLLLSQTLMKYQYLDKRDRAFISRLFRGTLEYEIFLDGVIRQFSSVRLNKIKTPIKAILRMSVYQILKMDHIPDAALCEVFILPVYWMFCRNINWKWSALPVFLPAHLMRWDMFPISRAGLQKSIWNMRTTRAIWAFARW